MTSVGNTDIDDEESHHVLGIYHRKNQSVKAPNPNTLFSSHGYGSGPRVADGSRSHISGSCVTDGSCSHSGSSHIAADGSHSYSGGSCVADGSHGHSGGSHIAADGSHGHGGGSYVADGPHGQGGSSLIAADGSYGCNSFCTANGPHSTNNNPCGPSNSSRHSNNGSCAPSNGFHTPDGLGSCFAESGVCDDSLNHFDCANTPDGHNPDVNVTSPGADIENDHNGNVSDDGRKTTAHAACNSKPCGEAKPSQLGFYGGPWLDVLVDARNIYKWTVHTIEGEAFTECNTENLVVAHNILLEAISDYIEHGGQLNECLLLSLLLLKLVNDLIAVYNANSSGMTAYIFNL